MSGSWQPRGLPTVRFLKFSLVGAIGIGVQLAVLAALTAKGVNYLLATALAVESAVLHNFLWHQRFTWAERAASAKGNALPRLLRFHVSNGLISLLGNLLLMRLLAGWLGMPVMVANVLTIGVCSLANFVASDRWVFLGPVVPCALSLPWFEPRNLKLTTGDAQDTGFEASESVGGVFSSVWSGRASAARCAARTEHK